MPTEIVFDSQTVHILSEIEHEAGSQTMEIIDELVSIAFGYNKQRIKIKRVRFLNNDGSALLTIERKK